MVKKGFLPNCNINEIKNYISTKLQLLSVRESPPKDVTIAKRLACQIEISVTTATKVTAEATAGAAAGAETAEATGAEAETQTVTENRAGTESASGS